MIIEKGKENKMIIIMNLPCMSMIGTSLMKRKVSSTRRTFGVVCTTTVGPANPGRGTTDSAIIRLEVEHIMIMF